ncbi:hypothetical protein [Burkholderia vietnamiensis]|uniref:hypothetical protein n=1 Tax=Burkholderia vietnamiensis TaxID=60552 RepID=UPI001D13D0B9|nr:hypothetical protein [Burkholderia vietnamiensis]UEC05442.1 hypothetical protein LK462_35125 [Burkholderia vietnamiensis]
MRSTDNLRVEHLPLHAARAGTPGEGLYLKLWQTFVEDETDAFAEIFRDMVDPIDQRVASIAASFMVFMGCNGGASFTSLAKTLWERGPFEVRSDAFLAAFAVENRRVHGINHDLRLAEAMLCVEHPIGEANCRTRVIWQNVPEITMKDMDALECMVAWWSTTRAEAMRAIAEPLISEANRQALRRQTVGPVRIALEMSHG